MSAHDDEFPIPSDSARQPLEKRTAITPISTEILRDALGFPDTVEIVGEPDGNINLTVRSALIPEGASDVIATWIRKGKDGEPEFRSFDPMRGSSVEDRIRRFKCAHAKIAETEPETLEPASPPKVPFGIKNEVLVTELRQLADAIEAGEVFPQEFVRTQRDLIDDFKMFTLAVTFGSPSLPSELKS